MGMVLFKGDRIMKRRILATLTSCALFLSVSGAAVLAEPTTTAPLFESDEAGHGKIKIYAYNSSGDLNLFVKDFLERNPDLAEKFTVITYRPGRGALDYYTMMTLMMSGETPADIYVPEADFLYDFIEGDYASSAAPYSDFIDDLDAKINNAELAEYARSFGKDSSGVIKALPYENTSGLFYYRKSIAKEVFGSDDPETVMDAIGSGTGDWNKYLEACEKLKAYGYAMTSSLDDVLNACNYASETPWVKDGCLSLDPNRAQFLDLGKIMADGGYTNRTDSWTPEWENDMSGVGFDQVTGKARQVFSFMGPLWFLHYCIQNSCGTSTPAYGDWGVCPAPVSFVWGGSGVIARKESIENEEKKEFISRFVEWLTLDCSQNGFQYSFASGMYTDGICDGVTSTKVMNMVNVNDPFLGGINPLAFLIKETLSTATGGYGEYKYFVLRDLYRSMTLSYALGDYSRDEAVENFKEEVAALGEIDVESNFVVPDPQLEAPAPYTLTPDATPTPDPATSPDPTPTDAPTPTKKRAKGKDTSEKKKSKSSDSSDSDTDIPAIVYVLIGVGGAATIAGVAYAIVLILDNKKKNSQK